MIELNAPIQQDKIIEFVDGLDIEGMTFTFKEKKGLKLLFETNAEDVEVAARAVREAIKAQPWGSVLYFQAVGIK